MKFWRLFCELVLYFSVQEKYVWDTAQNKKHRRCKCNSREGWSAQVHKVRERNTLLVVRVFVELVLSTIVEGTKSDIF